MRLDLSLIVLSYNSKKTRANTVPSKKDLSKRMVFKGNGSRVEICRALNGSVVPAKPYQASYT